MNLIARTLLIALLMLCAVNWSHAKRVALVMGNDNYTAVSKLQKAGNDADAMARELRAAGFAVQLQKNLNYRSMVKVVENFANGITGGDEVVVFFAGHGVQIRSGSYLLPIDIEADSESQVEKTAYGINDLTEKLSEAKAAFALVVIDACRDNPLKAKGRSIGATRGLSAVEPAKGQMIVYSASRGQQALDRLNDRDPSPNGVFTREFIARMKKPGVRIEDMVREVQDAVETLAKTVRHEQRPALYNETRGNFYFYGSTTVQVAPQSNAAPEMTQAQKEEKFWDDAKAAGNKEAYEAYLDSYPAGRYVSLAKANISRLTPPQAVAPPTVVAPVVIPSSPIPPIAQIQNAMTTTGQRPPPSSWSPSRTVQIIVPYPPGGLTDVVARAIAQGLARVGQQFVVDNRPGAAGLIGAQLLARSPADGHSLMVTSGSTFATLPSLFTKLPFDIQRDFAPISQVAKSPLILVSNPTSGIENPRDLVTRESTYASTGGGSIGHLAAESLKRILGAQRAVHVPYKGTGPALQDLLGGVTKWGIVDSGASVLFVRQGKLRAIALTGDARVAHFPNVPTFQEIGISGMNFNNWIGVWAPASTSPSIIGFYYHEVAKEVRAQQERLIAMGLMPSDMPPADLVRLIEVEKNSYGELIRSVAITIN